MTHTQLRDRRSEWSEVCRFHQIPSPKPPRIFPGVNQVRSSDAKNEHHVLYSAESNILPTDNQTCNHQLSATRSLSKALEEFDSMKFKYSLAVCWQFGSLGCEVVAKPEAAEQQPIPVWKFGDVQQDPRSSCHITWQYVIMLCYLLLLNL